MPDYALMNIEVPKLKAKLTRAKNSGDPDKTMDAVEAALDGFARFGWPDNWPTWRIGLEDVMQKYQYLNTDDERYDERMARFRALEDRFL